MNFRSRLAVIPASFFGMALGTAALGIAWRAAHRAWDLPAAVGEALLLFAAILWLVLVVIYAAKWILAREAALIEVSHPVQCCFIGLIGVTAMLVAAGALPYCRLCAEALFVAGALYTLAFAVWRTGELWKGGRDPGATTAVLYLPTVAGSFVMATGAANLGYPEWGSLAFGMGLFSWLAIESVLVHRLYTDTLPAMLRPTLGIQLAPPAVGAVAYISVTNAGPNLISYGLIGYAMLQALILLRLLPWIVRQPFAPSYWAFSFGVAALGTAPIRLIEHGDTGPVSQLAPYLFIFANVVIGFIAIGTVRLLLLGKLLPPIPQPAPKPVVQPDFPT